MTSATDDQNQQTPDSDSKSGANRRGKVVAIVAALVVVVGIVVGVSATATPIEHHGERAGPGGTTPPRAGERVQRIEFGRHAAVIALATEPGRSGVWVLTRTNALNDRTLRVWHYDPESGATRSWSLGARGPMADAFAACGDRVWIAAGGEYGGVPELFGLDPAHGTVDTYQVPAPKRANRTGGTGIEGPGRVSGITCHGSDGSIRFARSYWTSLWTLNAATGGFTEHAMPWDRLPDQLVADGNGRLALASTPQPPASLVTITNGPDGPGSDTSMVPMPGRVGLVGTRTAFLIIGAQEIQRVEPGGSQGGGAGTTAPEGIEFDVDDGGGILADGRIVALSANRLIVLDPTSPNGYRTIPVGPGVCQPMQGLTDQDDCLRASPLVAVDDNDHVFVTDPFHHAIDQVGIPPRR